MKPAKEVTSMVAANADDLFHSYITTSILKEGNGRYTNNPADRGGPTIWGVTESTARAFGYSKPMQEMTRDDALLIYRQRFWINPQFDKLAAVDPSIAALMLDLGINRGPSVPATWLQRALNVLNNQAKSYPDINVDGAAYNITRASLASFLRMRGAQGHAVLFRLIESFAAVGYVEIAEKNQSQETFEFGWLLNRAFQPEVTTT